MSDTTDTTDTTVGEENISERAAGSQDEAHINIVVSPNSIHYDSDLSLPEVAFWLDTVKMMIMNKVINNTPTE